MKKILSFLLIMIFFQVGLVYAGHGQINTIGNVVGESAPYISSSDEKAICGNEIIEKGEECEGNNLNDKTCYSYGFVGGSVSCKGCIIDTSNCILPAQPAGQLYNATEPGIKLSPNDLIIVIVIIIVIIGGILYYRYL